MKKYKKVNFNYYDYIEQDIILCEVCSSVAVDIHHLTAKGMGGSKTKDYIENLIGLCRKCHLRAHGPGNLDPLSKEELTRIHTENL